MGDSKKKRPNTIILVFLAVIAFFLIYFITFKVARMYIQSHTENVVTTIDTGGEKNAIQKSIEQRKALEMKKDLIERFKDSKKVYISDDEIENIKIEGETLESLKRTVDMFVKVRRIDGDFKPTNTGYTDGGIKFETDYDYFKLYTDKKEELYKVPVNMKSDFESMYRKMIYTSVDFITSNKGLGRIRLYHGNDEKGVFPWNKDDLIYKILYKREVGKIQPEKEFSRTKDNYTIKMNKSGVDISIQTMGKDFIKVTCGDSYAYYEVYPDLYNYLRNDIFKK